MKKGKFSGFSTTVFSVLILLFGFGIGLPNLSAQMLLGPKDVREAPEEKDDSGVPLHETLKEFDTFFVVICPIIIVLSIIFFTLGVIFRTGNMAPKTGFWFISVSTFLFLFFLFLLLWVNTVMLLE